MSDWLKAARLRFGEIPGDYVTFDVETTGLSAKTDLMAQIAFIEFRGDQPIREQTIWVDHTATMTPFELSTLELRLAATRNHIESRPSLYQIKYAVTLDRMRAGMPVDRSRQLVRDWMAYSRESKIPMVAHNAPFDSRFIKAFLADDKVFDSVYVFDTDVVERAVQAKPKLTHRDWFDFCRNCSGLGGSKYRSSLSDWCDKKYHWHVRGLVDMNNAHEARCDSWLTHLLLQEFKQASK